MDPKPILALQPQPVLVIQRRPISDDSDELPLVIIRQSTSNSAQEYPTPATSHVLVIERCIPLSLDQLQEDASPDDVTLPTTSTLSTTSTQLLLDTAQLTSIQVLP